MPYVTKRDRARVQSNIMKLRSAGELNYVITELMLGYVKEHGERYQTYNDIIGALEGAKLEFARRVVFPYEDKKIQQNGDVYE